MPLLKAVVSTNNPENSVSIAEMLASNLLHSQGKPPTSDSIGSTS